MDIFKLRIILYVTVICLLPTLSKADTCGISQSCFRSPINCFPASTCDYFVGWSLSNSGDALDFEVSLSGDNGYIALGFSKDQFMPMSDIIGCLSNSKILRYYASGRSPPAMQANVGLSNEVVTIVDGNTMYCSFTRQLSLVGQTNYFDLNDAHYLILAQGSRSGDSLDYHGNPGRWVSSQYDLTAADFRTMTTQRPVTNPAGGPTAVEGGPTAAAGGPTAAGDPTAATGSTAAAGNPTTSRKLPDPTTASPPLEGDPCGESQSCFRTPNNCYPASSCTYFVGWSVSQNMEALYFDFTMSGSNGYIALGFSKDAKMPNSDIVVCSSNGNFDRYYASSRTLPSKHDENGISDEDVVVDGGVITCSFTRQLSRDDQTDFFDLNENHFLLVAKGGLSGVTIVIHADKYVSDSSFNLTSAPFTVGGGDGDNSRAKKIKAHGSLMIIAWIGFVSIGIVTARFFKQAWPNTKVFGKAIWFRIHATCMVTAWVAFISSFILIFVTAEGWVGKGRGDNTFYHAIIGTAAVGLGTLNPIMAIFRPHPGTPRRPIFNVLHFGVGFLGWLCANVATFFGVRIYYMENEKATDIDAFNVLIGFAIFLVLMFVAFELHTCSTKKQGTTADNNIALDPITDTPFVEQQQTNRSNQRIEKPAGSTVKNILYILYVIGVLLTVVYLVVTIVIKDV